MASLTMYYDHLNEHLSPILLVIRFKQSEMDWSKTTLKIKYPSPYHHLRMEDFQDQNIGVNILLSDLVKNSEYEPDIIGIHLPTVKHRLEGAGVDILEIEQFIIRVDDLHEIFLMNIGAKKGRDIIERTFL
jgi:hypothetical protein